MKRLIPLFLLVSLNSFANTPRSSVSIATGGGGVASVEPGEATFMNPASLVHLQNRHFFTSFQDDLFALSLSENSQESFMPGAVSYFKARKQEMFGISLAQFVYQNISFGGTLTYWQAEGLFGEKRQSTLNANFGLTWSLSDRFGIGFAAENVFETPDEYKAIHELIPTSRFGLNYLLYEWFRWRLDFVTMKNNQWSEWVAQTGFESYLGRWFIVRAGVNAPPKDTAHWSLGFGFDMPRFRLDYASQWRNQAKSQNRSENLHSIDLTVPF